MEEQQFELNGESHTLTEWSVVLNIKYNTLYRRLHYQKLSVEEAFSSPLLKHEEIIIGNIYGNFKILELDKSQHETRGYYYKCKCLKCNNVIIKSSTEIRKRRQCKECMIANKIPNKRIYSIYRGMKDRCLNKNNKRYHCYGKRGIKICEEWLSTPEKFYDWAITNGYEDNLTIDRIDNNGNYEPNNCRWVSKKTQANNRSTNKFIYIEDKKYSLKEFSEKFNISYSKVKQCYKDNNTKYLINIIKKHLTF